MSNVRGKALYKGVGFMVGDERDVRFWSNDWVRMCPLSGLFPGLFRIVVNKET